MPSENENIVFIELHDSRIGSIAQHGDNEVAIEFSHLVVYVKVKEELYDVWSCTAKLILSDIGEIDIPSGINSALYISDDKITDASGNRMKLVRALKEPILAVASFELLFSDARKLTARDCKLELRLLDALEKFEIWEGPL